MQEIELTHLAELPTSNQIATAIGGSPPAAPAPSAATASSAVGVAPAAVPSIPMAAAEDVSTVVRSPVAETTGCPPGMVEFDGESGIDSINQVVILRSCPRIALTPMESLFSFRSVLDRLANTIGMNLLRLVWSR